MMRADNQIHRATFAEALQGLAVVKMSVSGVISPCYQVAININITYFCIVIVNFVTW